MPNDKVRVGIIPAAGAGSRLGYLSGLLPKTLFPLYDRPIVHYVVDQMQRMGVEDVYIIVNVFQEKIRGYFDLIKMDLRCKVHFIEQKELNGTANSILLVEKFTNKESFVVIYGDDCTITDSFDDMVNKFLETPRAVVMEGVVKEKDRNVLRNTCSVKLGTNGRMIEIIEKPEDPPYLMRGCGVYFFRDTIFDYIRKTPVHPVRNEREITYTINALAEEKRAWGYLIDGHNVNINDYNQLLRASHLVKMLHDSTQP